MMFKNVAKGISIGLIFVEFLWLLATFGWGAVMGGVILMGASMCYVGCYVEEPVEEDDEAELPEETRKVFTTIDEVHKWGQEQKDDGKA